MKFNILKLIQQPWLRTVAVLSVLSYILWLAVEWAMLPGFWGGSWLHSGDETALTLAQNRFGPILLVKYWITDPDGTWGDKWTVLQQWGQFESAARLRLIIITIWVAFCIIVLIPKLKRAQQSTSQNYSGGTPS
jgi:hypothetical protein